MLVPFAALTFIKGPPPAVVAVALALPPTVSWYWSALLTVILWLVLISEAAMPAIELAPVIVTVAPSTKPCNGSSTVITFDPLLLVKAFSINSLSNVPNIVAVAVVALVTPVIFKEVLFILR